MEDKKQKESEVSRLRKQKEESDRRLLRAEIVIGVLGILFLLALVIISSYIVMAEWIRILLVSIGAVVCFVACFICLRIEQVTGYYECFACHHRYIPSYKQVGLAMHFGRTRYMKCPHCGKKSWSKKVVSDTDE